MAGEFVVELTHPTYGGECLGRLPDGRAVFVPFTLPGEKARIRIVEDKPKFARGEIIEIITPSKNRIPPRCHHFKQCGGCHYQHINYPTQLELKKAILIEQLERIGGIISPPVQDVLASPEPWNYRNIVQFHLTPEGKVGFSKSGSHQVLPIQECHLPKPEINNLWPMLELEPVPGLERLEIRSGANEDMMLVLESSSEVPPEFEIDIPLSVMHLGPAGGIVLSGNGYVIIEVMDKPFSVSGGSFFQVNPALAGAMVMHLLHELPIMSTSEVLDVYCGVGLFSAFLAPRVAHCTGIELSTTACLDFTINLDMFDNVDLYEGDADIVLSSLTIKPDIIIVDPPRAGLDRRVLDSLTRMKADTLAYVSCDPATLARDTRRLLAAGYHLDMVTLFDLFPQTYHIESISLFTPIK